MTKQAHTPGPWKFGGKNSWEIFAPGEGEAICIINAAEDWQDGLLDVKHERKIAEANARLIASAPELLEACKCLVDSYDTCGEVEWAYLLSKQAIAKATEVEK